jgi:hypothetical protein
VDGDEWKQQRRVASFEFASSVLRNFSTDVFRECALKLIFHVAHNARSSSTFDLQVVVQFFLFDPANLSSHISVLFHLLISLLSQQIMCASSTWFCKVGG